MPISTVGDKEASKKAQKKLTKKKTSDRIKRSIATRKQSSNLWVWNPIRLSRRKSFHQSSITKKTERKEKSTENKDSFKLIQSTVLNNKENTEKERIRGQKEDWTAKNGDLNKMLSIKSV